MRGKIVNWKFIFCRYLVTTYLILWSTKISQNLGRVSPQSSGLYDQRSYARIICIFGICTSEVPYWQRPIHEESFILKLIRISIQWFIVKKLFFENECWGTNRKVSIHFSGLFGNSGNKSVFGGNSSQQTGQTSSIFGGGGTFLYEAKLLYNPSLNRSKTTLKGLFHRSWFSVCIMFYRRFFIEI